MSRKYKLRLIYINRSFFVIINLEVVFVLKFRDNVHFTELKDIYIHNGDKILSIFYGGNGDLYFDIFCEEDNEVLFNIDKESEVYPYFHTLFDSVINCNVYKDSPNLNKMLVLTKANEDILCDGKIVWFSESTYTERANKLTIEKNSAGISLSFTSNPLDEIYGFGIRICNSGCRYKPFNLCFMNLYNSMQGLVSVDSKKGGVQKTKS